MGPPISIRGVVRRSVGRSVRNQFCNQFFFHMKNEGFSSQKSLGGSRFDGNRSNCILASLWEGRLVHWPVRLSHFTFFFAKWLIELRVRNLWRSALFFSFILSFFLFLFLVACTRLHKPLCRSVGRSINRSVNRSVRRSVGPSVGPSVRRSILTFFSQIGF